MSEPPLFIRPEWPAPAKVRALATTRCGGYSAGPRASFNLAMHVDDDPDAVRRNRALLRKAANLPAEPMWLQQVHGTTVWSGGHASIPPTADASVAKASRDICVILTADCLPVLLCDEAGAVVAAAHAGWRGLVGGVLATTIGTMAVAPARLMAWLGPAIEADAFEVGSEVREQFVARNPANGQAFKANTRGRWQADLYELARIELHSLGVRNVFGGGFATFADRDRFYSYRREQQTGRMASLIWLEP